MTTEKTEILMNLIDTHTARILGIGEAPSEYSEIFKLDDMLTESGIPHDLHPFQMRGWQITYSKDGNWEWRKPGCGDVVLHNGSYGHEHGLMEAGGFDITREEYGDEVLGWLNAEKAFAFFKRQYEKDCKEEKHE